MLSALPVLAFILIWLNFLTKEHPLRRSLLLAAVLWGVLLFSITEGLSLFHRLEWQWVAAGWTAILAVSLWILLRRRDALIDRWKQPRKPCPWGTGEWFLIFLVLAILLFSGVIAGLAAPVNFDSYTYHLPRVLHWIQERSVAFFPTHLTSQVRHPPFGEYMILHTLILSGNDRWANFIQWACMVGSVITVSHLAGLFGAKARGQIFAAVICATIPLGILESTTTQNDYVAAFWLLASVTLAWDFLTRETERINWLLVSEVGAAFGLTLLTKAVYHIFAFPFILLFAAAVIRRYGRRSIAPLCVAGVLTLSLVITHYARNWQLSGHFLGPPDESFAGSYINPEWSAAVMTSNGLRYLAVELNTPWQGINHRIESATRRIHGWLGWNPDNPEWNLANLPFQMPWIWSSEDLAGSPLQTLLLLACIPLVWRLKDCRRGIIRLHLAATLAAALLFFLFLRWQIYGIRFLLGILILSAPVAAILLEQLRWRWLTAVVLTILVLLAGKFLFVGKKNIFTKSRMDRRFHYNRPVRHQYRQIALQIRQRGCRNVGLVVEPNQPEYPMWIMLQKHIPDVRIEHVDVHNFTSPIAQSPRYGDFHPCAIIRIDSFEKITLLPPTGAHSHSHGS